MGEYATDCVNSIRAFGYDCEVYDLGGLGYGIDFPVPGNDLHFELPRTEDDPASGRVSKSLFKPAVIKDARNRFPGQTLIWVDADTVLRKEFKIGTDFDIGVAQRPQSELWLEMSGDFAAQDRIGKYNAGMIIFNPTGKTGLFIELWSGLTASIMNDQIALNRAIKQHIAAVKVLPFHYNSPQDSEKTVLYHIKGKKRSSRGLFQFLKRLVKFRRN